MVKNAGKLYYPFKESVLSILPLVDEFVIAIGDCDPEDDTLEMIDAINSPKIKLVHTKWDVKAYPKGSILAQQTDVAKEHCTGDWLFYLQADEVIHEKDHEAIVKTCHQYLNDHVVEGLLFKYIHFWGDYNHAFTSNHVWYRNEIRIIRNKPEIHSWRDAQSFRAINSFSKEKYLCNVGTRKLKVARIDAHIYHYGWVRPPLLMGKKQAHFGSCYKEDNSSKEELEILSQVDFGPMDMVPEFSGVHPATMKERIESFNWADQLNYSKVRKRGKKQKHERLKYRFISFLEKMFFKEFGLFTFKNYTLHKLK
ncbi:MAG: glycosyltransferase family 2 protein [Marinilabiliaceae bacterium]|nr:glycosyltransferase family 2 protein [Marinilabiliaceae bacterium]